jgi:hypothetical protein
MSQFLERLNVAVALTVPFLGRKSASMHLSASHKTVLIIGPAEGMVLAFFLGDGSLMPFSALSFCFRVRMVELSFITNHDIQ